MKHQTKIILGGFMGNIVEAYDVSICYFLSRELSRALIGESQGNPTIVLALIFLAYLAKPIGAFILGLFSDLYGRKNVLIFSILIMGLSTTAIGLIPGFNRIGLWAAGLLLILRTIQSMALGSEFLNSVSYLVESGAPMHRGFRGCWPSVGVKAGYLLACIIVESTFSYGNNFDQMHDWLWRIPFLLALLTTLMGIYLRYQMPESLAYIIYYAERKRPTTKILYSQTRSFVKKNPFLLNYAFFASFLSVAIGYFFYLYIPLHAMQYSHLSHSFIRVSTSFSLAFVIVLIPIFGWLSDYHDRLKMLAFATCGVLFLSYPFMHAINFGNKTYFIVMQLIISIPCACYHSVYSVSLTELFPLQIRCTALSIIFSIAASLASGLPPLLSDYLARKTELPSSPCFIIMALSLVVLINIKSLYSRYRLGINQYNTATGNEEELVFTLYYEKSVNN